MERNQIRREALLEAARLIRCDCCDVCGESPEFEHACAAVLAKRIELLALGKPHSKAAALDALEAKPSDA